MRFWDDKDGAGTKLTDGRVCLVIQNPEMPEIRTYGKDREEVLDKLANTTETAQLQIHRMRKTPAASGQPPAASRPVAPDLKAAAADLTNPSNVRTLLRAAGVDVDGQIRTQVANKIAALGLAWQAENPDFPMDPRNQRMLMDRAIILAGGRPENLTAASLDKAYEELAAQEVFHAPKNLETPAAETVHPEGTPDSRTVRNATSYRRNALTSPEPAARAKGDTAQEAKWRAIRDTGTSEAQERAIRTDPGYVKWCDEQSMKKTA
jgi:hypothetical protein